MRISLRNHLRQLLAVLGITALLIAATPLSSSAQQSGNNGLQISPTRTDLSINPGDSNSFQITLKNISSISLTAKAILNDFQSDNETGFPKLLTNPNQRTANSIKPFLSGLTDVPLKSGESKVLQLAVNVPKSSAPGGYYGALRFSAIPDKPSENVGQEKISLTASVASLVLMEINGPVNESLTLDSMKPIKDKSPGSIFFGKGPDHVAIKISNKGNGFSQPIGRVTIKKGDKEVYSYEFNTDQAGLHNTVLPNSSRTFTDAIKNANSFGQYTISASIAYKQGSEAITVNQRFWVVTKSVEYGLLALIILVAIGVGIWQLTRSRSTRRR